MRHYLHPSQTHPATRPMPHIDPWQLYEWYDRMLAARDLAPNAHPNELLMYERTSGYLRGRTEAHDAHTAAIDKFAAPAPPQAVEQRAGERLHASPAHSLIRRVKGWLG
jgi:hypothetical protein